MGEFTSARWKHVHLSQLAIFANTLPNYAKKMLDKELQPLPRYSKISLVTPHPVCSALLCSSGGYASGLFSAAGPF